MQMAEKNGFQIQVDVIKQFTAIYSKPIFFLDFDF
jgi:hypothetical protein